MRATGTLIVGSPNHQGADHAVREFEQFPIVGLWGTDEVAGKVCAAFATGGGFGDAGAGAGLMIGMLVRTACCAGLRAVLKFVRSEIERRPCGRG